MPALLPFGFWEGGRKAASGGRRCGHGPCSSLTRAPPLTVPTRYGVVLGAVIGGVLGGVLLLLLLFYLVRYCWLRRQAALQRRLR